MIKKNSGYVLAETLIVTAFVAGILIYLLTQLTHLNNNYEKTQNYNKVPNLYALIDVAYYIKNNSGCANYVTSIGNDITELSNSNCSGINNIKTKEEISDLYVCKNKENECSYTSLQDTKLKDFIKTIAWETAVEEYRLIAKFNDGSYGTFKF